jgi:predicted dehydrogenase
VAAIGVGGSRGAHSRGREIALQASQHARMIAVCDVDAVHTAEFNAKFDNKLAMYTDYRRLLENEKPDIVTIGTTDQWHVPIAMAALRAGCDVYCEKPLTLTIEEGILIRDAVKETGRVFQVGTQQRSEMGLVFLKAVALVKSGRLGKNVCAHVAIDGSPIGGPFPTTEPIAGLDWNLWLGPAQQADYSPERRKEFRWFYDYSGGKMTDWGAHHIDIAQWALGKDQTGPTKISGTCKFTPLVPDHFDWVAYFEGRATLPNGYHTPPEFHINLTFDDGALLTVGSDYHSEDGQTSFTNGILFEGDDGRIFVNRGKISGKLVEDLSAAGQQELDDQVIQLYNGKQPGDHMRNFFECIASRQTPISDVATHHRSMTSCHLCNIALMLGREIAWDPAKEEFIGDEQATMLKTRPRREPFSWSATT